jgi:hypothetical protein
MESASVWKSASLSKNPNGVGDIVVRKLAMIAPILEDKYAFINDLVSSAVSFYGPFLTFRS